MPFSIVRDDLVAVPAEAYVLPSNSALALTGGAGARVAQVAGAEKLQAACDAIGCCSAGSAVVTPSFDFPAPARCLIHAVGPVWDGGMHGEEATLAQAYRRALGLAVENDCASIAFPLIGAGAFGFPPRVALDVATDAIRAFLDESDDIDVTLVVYDEAAFRASLACFDDVSSFIGAGELRESRDEEETCEEELRAEELHEAMLEPCEALPAESSCPQGNALSGFFGRFGSSREAASAREAAPVRESAAPAREVAPMVGAGVVAQPSMAAAPVAKPSMAAAAAPQPREADDDVCYGVMAFEKASAAPESLEEWLSGLDEGFSTTLFQIIDRKGLTDPQVYKRANITRQTFSNIRSDAHYKPKKATALALCVALELSLAEASDLLARAGLAFNPSDRRDRIVEYFIIHEKYDLLEINAMLFSFDCPLLGNVAA